MFKTVKVAICATARQVGAAIAGQSREGPTGRIVEEEVGCQSSAEIKSRMRQRQRLADPRPYI